jgi:hypothetical protein
MRNDLLRKRQEAEHRLYYAGCGNCVANVSLLSVQKWLVSWKWLTNILNYVFWKKLVKLFEGLNFLATRPQTVQAGGFTTITSNCTSGMTVDRIDLWGVDVAFFHALHDSCQNSKTVVMRLKKMICIICLAITNNLSVNVWCISFQGRFFSLKQNHSASVS